MIIKYGLTKKITHRHADSWESRALARLNIELREILNAFPTKESPGRGRDRYIRALSVLCDFLADQGFNQAVVNSFKELEIALEELDKGTVRHFLYADKVKGPDPGDLWCARACVVIAADFLGKRCDMKEGAARHKVAGILNKFEITGFFTTELCGAATASRQTSNRRFNPAEAIRGWRRTLLDAGKCPSARAAYEYSRREKFIEDTLRDVIADGLEATPDNVVRHIIYYAAAIGAQAADGKKLADIPDINKIIRRISQPFSR